MKHYASEELITYLDNNTEDITNLHELFEDEGVFDKTPVHDWVYQGTNLENMLDREMAVVNHVLYNERIEIEHDTMLTQMLRDTVSSF